MRILKAKALLAGLLIVAACVTIDTTVTRRVQIGESTFIVISYGEIGQVDDNDKTTASSIYQITNDGRYRRLGNWLPPTYENIQRNSGGIGVYSEADRELVSIVLKKSGEDKDNYLTIDNRNVATPEEAVTVLFGVPPIKVDSPGRLKYSHRAGSPKQTTATPAPTAAEDSDGSAETLFGLPPQDPQ